MTATDVVLTITELLRRHGVVGKFVEAFGPGVAALSLETRATIGNMSPEYGSTCTIFPIDQVTLDYLAFTGRDDEHVALVEAYAKRQGLWHDPTRAEPVLLRGRRARPRDRRAVARRPVAPPGPRLARGACATRHARAIGREPHERRRRPAWPRRCATATS